MVCVVFTFAIMSLALSTAAVCREGATQELAVTKSEQFVGSQQLL